MISHDGLLGNHITKVKEIDDFKTEISFEEDGSCDLFLSFSTGGDKTRDLLEKIFQNISELTNPEMPYPNVKQCYVFTEQCVMCTLEGHPDVLEPILEQIELLFPVLRVSYRDSGWIDNLNID